MILITGINGFIANNIYNNLKYSNIEVIGTTKEDSKNITNILIEKKPEYIYHTGAELYDNDKMFNSNILLTYQILEYCRTANNLKRLIIIGSSSEYGRKQHPISETDILEPQTIYEGTKSAASLLAQSYSYTYNIPIFIIRPFTIYGIGEKSNKFIQLLFKKIRNNEKQVSVSNGVHDYVYIDDFINALFEIVYKNKNIFDILNIGSGIQTTNMNVIKIFEKINNYYFDEYVEIQSKPYDSNMWLADNTKLQKYYKIKYTLEDGIKLMKDKLK